ncbi:hypothetical protein HanXRQr2_Chr05g0221811 [Helianthus annuus]|uniref:Uncharacterized protein n=1 Tax=Helianthus annuus TaxID=4232 RepID=A0A9K3NN66_HELAN|nr:hypothetical protein HanXRQr2_Chr05g0221811 [Helianthus annuus]
MAWTYILSSLLLGAQVMISSTLRIISAASVAESNTACFTLNASDIPSTDISPTCNHTHFKMFIIVMEFYNENQQFKVNSSSHLQRR